MFALVKFCLESPLIPAWSLPSNRMSLFIQSGFLLQEPIFLYTLWILGNTLGNTFCLESKLCLDLTTLIYSRVFFLFVCLLIYILTMFFHVWMTLLLLLLFVSKTWTHYSILHVFSDHWCLLKLKDTVLANSVRGPAREQFSNLRLSLHIV